MTMLTTGYWVDAPGRGSLREVVLPERSSDDVLLQAICTGISPGTERLVGCGRVPPICEGQMACRGMQGSFALPALYGYSFVGRVDGGPDNGRRAFVMRPHQQHAIVPRAELLWLPDDIPDARATLFPNLETARNAVWDAEVKSADRVLVVGAGVVGLLVAFVLAHDHGDKVTVVERDATRRSTAASLPWIRSAVAPEDVQLGSFQHAMHTSASSDGLQIAIDAVGFEGQVIELSWYGDQAVSVQLGTSFHSQRKRIVASQVSTIARNHRADGFQARREAVLDLLTDPRLDGLLEEPTPFASLPNTFTAIYRRQLAALCPVVGY